MDRYDKNIGKRKSKWPMGCPAHPMNIAGDPGTCSGPPGAIPDAFKNVPKALPRLSQTFLGASRSSPAQVK